LDLKKLAELKKLLDSNAINNEEYENLKRYYCRMKKHKLNWNLYPDSISNSLTVFDNLIWDRAYYLETDDGVWYEMYVNDLTKSENANIDEDIENEDLGLKNSLEGFHGLLLDHYEEHSQITFFVPNDEKEFTFNEMSNFFS